jgi:hypothetical protein
MIRPILLLRRSLLASCGLASALAVVFAAGCGDEQVIAHPTTLYPVKGSVLLENGKPLTGGLVVFVSTDGMLSVPAPVSPDGSFDLKSDKSVGAPVGDYKVRIEADTTGKKTKGSSLPFAKKYLDEDSSEIKVTVKAEPNTLPPFKLAIKDTAPASAPAGRRSRD